MSPEQGALAGGGRSHFLFVADMGNLRARIGRARGLHDKAARRIGEIAGVGLQHDVTSDATLRCRGVATPARGHGQRGERVVLGCADRGDEIVRARDVIVVARQRQGDDSAVDRPGRAARQNAADEARRKAAAEIVQHWRDELTLE